MAVSVTATVLGGLAWFWTRVPREIAELSVLIEQNPVLTHRLGVPIQRSWLWTGQTRSDRVIAHIPFTGPQGSAMVHVKAVQFEQHWEVLALEAQFNGSPEYVELLEQPHPIATGMNTPSEDQKSNH